MPIFVWDKFPCHVYVVASICGCSNHLESLCGWNRLPNLWVEQTSQYPYTAPLLAGRSCLMFVGRSKHIKTHKNTVGCRFTTMAFWWSTQKKHGMPWFHGTSMWILKFIPQIHHISRDPRLGASRSRCLVLVGIDSSPFHGKMPWVSCRVSIEI